MKAQQNDANLPTAESLARFAVAAFWLTISAAASAADGLRLPRAEAPKAGRFTVLYQDFEPILVPSKRGRSAAGGTTGGLDAHNSVGALYRDQIVAALAGVKAYQYVPIDAPVTGTIGLQGYYLQMSTDTLVALNDIMLTDQLDFVLVVSPSWSINQTFGGAADFRGIGIYDATVLGIRRAVAFSAFQLTLLEAKSGRAIAHRGLSTVRIEDRWPEAKDGSGATQELLFATLREAEATVAVAPVKAMVCTIGLLPIEKTADMNTAFTRCRKRYPAPHQK